ncbi:MAG TPA: hypothetical protein VGA85_02820 [Dehalococcoidales bacterium]
MYKCPNCGAELNLALVMDKGDTVNQITRARTANFQIKRITYNLSSQDIIEAAESLESQETIRKYYVELADREGKIQEFPIKQVVRKALKKINPSKFTEDYFTAHRARDILKKLGFEVKTR